MFPVRCLTLDEELAAEIRLFSGMRSTVLGLTFVAAVASNTAAQGRVVERVRPNDNRARAGLVARNVLAVRMEARLAEWHPQGEDAPGAVIPVFAELGRPAQIPGPLIRVTGGTEVIVVIRNAVPNTVLTVHGLHARPAIAPAGQTFTDSIQLTYGQVQQLRFRLDRPGTYYYWGTTTGASFENRTREDSQLTGVIVVDEPGERTPRDRIMVLGMWADTTMSETTRRRNRELHVINGRSWPHTDRLIYEKGEVVRWRVVNASADLYPMHLHGYFFRVTRRGNGMADTLLSRAELVHTERMMPGQTMSLTFTPDRLGRWLFHSAVPGHTVARGPLGYPPQDVLPTVQGGTAAPPLGGLVAAMEVNLPEDDTSHKLPPSPIPEPTRRLRMILQPNAGTSPLTPLYGVFIDTAGLTPEVDRGQRVGPPLILNRGQQVSVMLINRIGEPTSMHWHGIELDNGYDGVPGVSGIRPAVLHPIPTNDSLDVRMAPPRAGTFMYHSHYNDARQQRAGLVGPLIVVEPGRWDPTKDFPVLFSSPSDSTEEDRAVLVNGSTTPLALDMRRGVAHRLRLMNGTTGRPGLVVELHQGLDTTTLASWRPVAKDGIDIPAAARGARGARQPLSIGETMDFEFTPIRAGDYKLEARTRNGTLLATLPVRVQ